MDAKLCRICGASTTNHVHIFKTEGLKNKIETCLPIIVSPHSLLPDTICVTCSENVDNFYSFIKNCLQNIIVLEAQYDITTESCLKTKRKYDRTTMTTESYGIDKQIQTDDYLDVLLKENRLFLDLYDNVDQIKLVDYSDTEEDDQSCKIQRKAYFDDQENYLIDEIIERKNLKRKSESDFNPSMKRVKYDCNRLNRRKTRKPKKYELNNDCGLRIIPKLPSQICLLCDERFEKASMLAEHVYQMHGIDMMEIIETVNNDKRKKLPELLRISELKKNDEALEEPPMLLPSFVCPLCPAVFTIRPDLFAHLRQRHPTQAATLCGICLYQADTSQQLANHVDVCAIRHPTNNGRYYCAICRLCDDNPRTLEHHVCVHDFLIEQCRRQPKIFDPADYVAMSTELDITRGATTFTCTECEKDFDDFRLFSAHRRDQHSIFHCDLCNKFYGRNSHLWKHVNRLHKGHPSVTCQLCYKTSASKYHLAQHFQKIHCRSRDLNDTNIDFMNRKFEAFDFQSVKQSFMRQELLEREKKAILQSEDDSNVDEDEDEEEEPRSAPKAIDSTSDLYTNIITNYTPPTNEGDFKCPKCSKAFHKKNLLKKHKKNCRPRLQKDLLTRCKSCARIFKDRQSLAKHLVNYHSEYSCEICGEKVQSKCEIVAHIRFTHRNCHLYCQQCGMILRSRADLDAHLREHSDSYVCQFCADALPSKIKLKMHILSLHRKILALSCGICLKLFETQHILRDHVSLVHKDQLTPLTSCPVCGKNYGSKWKTYDHLNKSHGRIFRACKTCLEIFDTDAQLQAHNEAAHVTRPVVVPPPTPTATGPTSQVAPSTQTLNGGDTSDSESDAGDSKPTNNTAAAAAAKRTVYVNSNDPSRCEICLKTWPAKKHLWQHYIRCHKSVAATVCGICLKTNEDYNRLQCHLRTMHPNLLHGQGFGSNFICRICGRYHNASSKLKLHMAIHENFDWSLLDDKKQQVEEDINYESLIEQVECSSSEGAESDGDDGEEEEGEDGGSKNQSSSEDEEDDDDDDDDEDEDGGEAGDSSGGDSVLLDGGGVSKGSASESSDLTDLKSVSSDEEKHTILINDDGEVIDAADEDEEAEDDVDGVVVVGDEVEEVEDEDDEDTGLDEENLFQCAADQLDSAIQSISYDDTTQRIDEENGDDYVELQMSHLNENEIESAVGSIL